MCGIVGAVAQRDISEILVEGLRRLEYRGYDSAGVAIINAQGELQRVRRLGKVQELANALEAQPLSGGTGIAHTRWATHGEPSEINAHPHVSNGDLAVVHDVTLFIYLKVAHDALKVWFVEHAHTFSFSSICMEIDRARCGATNLIVDVDEKRPPFSVKQTDGNCSAISGRDARLHFHRSSDMDVILNKFPRRVGASDAVQHDEREP